MLTVSDGTVVSMDYTLRLDDESVIDTSEGRGPLEFIQGQGQIIPGLEKELYGMNVGDEKLVVVQPSEGYGEFNSDLFETLPRTMFSPDIDLEKGMGFRMQTPTGQVVVAYVDEVREDEVVVNLNHPLAGETLHFDVSIADVRLASDEERAGGGCASCAGCGSGQGCDDEGCEGDCEGGEDRHCGGEGHHHD